MIKTSVNEQLDLTYYSVEGNVSAEQIIETIEAFYGANPTSLVLWDFSATDVNHLKTSEIERIANVTKKYSYKGQDLNTALVFSSDVDFGLGRMFEAYSQTGKINQKIMSFHSVEDARIWLEAEN